MRTQPPITFITWIFSAGVLLSMANAARGRIGQVEGIEHRRVALPAYAGHGLVLAMGCLVAMATTCGCLHPPAWGRWLVFSLAVPGLRIRSCFASAGTSA